MPSFEFVVEGPPVSLNATNHTAGKRRYKKWVNMVRAAAQTQWPMKDKPIDSEVAVEIRNYFTLSPPDVDNIIKPILDGLKTLVYLDDQQVAKVICERIDLSKELQVTNPSVLLAGALARYDELLHIVVTWEKEN